MDITIPTYEYLIKWYNADIESIKDEEEREEKIRIYHDTKTVKTLMPLDSVSEVSSSMRLEGIIKPYDDMFCEIESIEELESCVYVDYIVVITNKQTNKTNKYKVGFTQTFQRSMDVKVLA